MGIDIAAPGASEAALKAALAALGMPVLLASGSFSSPVSSVDLDLPSGYSSFKLILSEFQVDENFEDSFNCQFSFDGGDTFASDNEYVAQQFWAFEDADHHTQTVKATSTSLYLANGYPSESASGTSGYSLFCELNLYPGSATLYPTVYCSGVTVIADGGEFANFSTSGMYKGQKARASNIRLITSVGGDDLARGTYRLFGIV